MKEIFDTAFGDLLTKEELMIVHLRDFDFHTFEDIAEKLGKNRQKVYSLYQGALNICLAAAKEIKFKQFKTKTARTQAGKRLSLTEK